MSGSAFENFGTDPEQLAGLRELRLIFEGGPGVWDAFEVAGEDRGATMAGFSDNFALATLEIGGAKIGQVRLSDAFDNQTDWVGVEALYVAILTINAGSTFDLSGHNVYCLNLVNNGGNIVLNGGGLYTVPKPSTLVLLLAVGFAVLLRLITPVSLRL